MRAVFIFEMCCFALYIVDYGIEGVVLQRPPGLIVLALLVAMLLGVLAISVEALSAAMARWK